MGTGESVERAVSQFTLHLNNQSEAYLDQELNDKFRTLLKKTNSYKGTKQSKMEKFISNHKLHLQRYLLQIVAPCKLQVTEDAYEKMQHFDETNINIRKMHDPKRMTNEFTIFGYHQDKIVNRWSHLPHHMTVHHPTLYPEMYKRFSKTKSFGNSAARNIIIDGSNIALGHGKHNTGQFLAGHEYSHEKDSTVFSFLGIKIVCEELWRRGCFCIHKNENQSVVDIMVTVPLRNINGARVPPEQKVILEQMQDLGMIIDVDEPTFNEDMTILDYSMQTGAGLNRCLLCVN